MRWIAPQHRRLSGQVLVSWSIASRLMSITFGWYRRLKHYALDTAAEPQTLVPSADSVVQHGAAQPPVGATQLRAICTDVQFVL